MKAPTEEDLRRWIAPTWHSRKWSAADAAHIVWARWIASPMQTQRTIAQHFGVTASRIHQLEHHLVATLARNTMWSAEEPQWGEWLASEAPLATAIRDARRMREEGTAHRRKVAELQAAGYAPCPACGGTGIGRRYATTLPWATRTYIFSAGPPPSVCIDHSMKDAPEKPTE